MACFSSRVELGKELSERILLSVDFREVQFNWRWNTVLSPSAGLYVYIAKKEIGYTH